MARRMAACLLALLMLSGVARAATLCVNAPGIVALTDENGNTLLEGEDIAQAFSVREGALYAAGSLGAYRLYDAQGQPLGDRVFSMIDDAGDALVFRDGALFGALDASGAVLLEAQWTQLTPDGTGGWLALDGDPLDEQADEIIHIDPAGAVRRTGVFTASGLAPVSGGRMPYMNAEGRCGALDASGAVAIAPVWQYVGAFHDGVAKVTGPEGMGMIDGEGRVVIPANHSWLERSAAMVAAWDGTELDIYGPRGGQRRFSLSGQVGELALVGECLSVAYAGRVRLYDARGRLLSQSASGTVYAAGTRGQLIASDGEWGEKCQWLVNPDGRTASGKYQQILPLCAGRYAFLEMSGTEYYSAELGKAQVSWDYDGRRYGVMDSAGRVIIPAEYLEIQSLGEDRLLLIGADAVRLATRDGATIRTWFTPGSEAPTGEGAE